MRVVLQTAARRCHKIQVSKSSSCLLQSRATYLEFHWIRCCSRFAGCSQRIDKEILGPWWSRGIRLTSVWNPPIPPPSDPGKLRTDTAVNVRHSSEWQGTTTHNAGQYFSRRISLRREGQWNPIRRGIDRYNLLHEVRAFDYRWTVLAPIEENKRISHLGTRFIVSFSFKKKPGRCSWKQFSNGTCSGPGQHLAPGIWGWRKRIFHQKILHRTRNLESRFYKKINHETFNRFK